jgi:molybdate transport system ATP-binding protein
VVFQDYLLFAHLSALENVAFGLRARGTPRAEARRRAGEWLERVGLSSHASHRPHALSGGQAQRVALARALATDPRLLLLDEPLAALDAGTRSGVRHDLRRHLDSFDGMRVLVTHDPVDAYALADRVAILDAGRVVQIGTIAEVTAHPRSRYVADLIGTNLVVGTVTDGVLTTDAGARVVIADAPPGRSFAVIRPQAIALLRDEPVGSSARNVWSGTVGDIDRLGDRVRVGIVGALPLTAEITAAALEAMQLRHGDETHALVKATDIEAYPV